MKEFYNPSFEGLYGTKEELEDTEDYYPYIYIPINI
jgi:V-type H+-transporting ATPase subunit C